MDLPKGVQVAVDGATVKVKGPKGQLERSFRPEIGIAFDGSRVVLTRPSDEPAVRALHGTTRALIQNMVTGVSVGYAKSIQIEGVGYRAEMKGAQLVMSLGFSHPVVVDPPPGISFGVDERTRIITVSGIDKAAVGQVASDVRSWRPPEPYKGKGLRYVGERVRRKAGKAGKAA